MPAPLRARLVELLMRTGFLGVPVLATVLFGCGGMTEESGIVGGCDITTAACQRATFAAAAEVRGQSGAKMPPVRIISHEQFVDLLNEEVADAAGTPDPWSAPLGLLGLIPEGSSIADQQASNSADNVAAYYETESKDVTVIEREGTDPLDDVFVLAHEFVHSLQDAEVGIGEFEAAWVDSLDSHVASRSLIEGEANVLGIVVLGRALSTPARLLNWEGVTESWHDYAFDTIEQSSSPLFAAAQLLPYPLGTAQLGPLWLDRGQRPIDELYATPRLSVLDWAEDTSVTAPSRREALACEPTSGPSGYAGVESDAFGPAGVLSLLLRAGERIGAAWSDALESRGDRVVLFQRDGAPDDFAITWRIRFESVAAAESFEARVGSALSAGVDLLRDDREVLLFGASDDAALSAWTNVSDCGTPEELPVPADTDPGDSALRRLARSRGLH